MRIAIAALLSLLTAGAALATITSSAITGRVRAGDGAAEGVTVTVTSAALQHERTATTTAHGWYWIGALPPGTYDVTFARKGMQTLTRRAIVELGRTARADATLEASEDEESVTSTVTTVAVAETTAITTHFSDAELDRLPYRRSGAAIELTPVAFTSGAVVDDAPLQFPLLGDEVLEQVTAVRGALPAETEGFAIGYETQKTRSGSEEFSLSLRDSWTDSRLGGGHLYETASGGRIVPGKLWFFAGGWSGDSIEYYDASGVVLKLTGQLGSAHNVIGEYVVNHAYSTQDPARDPYRFGGDWPALRYTGVLTERLTVEAVAMHFTEGMFGTPQNIGEGKVSYRAGEQVFSAGGGKQLYGPKYFFFGDRLSWRGLTLDAGARHEDDHFYPRAAMTWDFRGDGRQAFFASYGEYWELYHGMGPPVTRDASVGYATAIGNSGSARIDYLRRASGSDRFDQIELDTRYRLFDRFEAGASYTHLTASPFSTRDSGDAWIGAQLPVGSHELGATVIEHYLFQRLWTTDLAVRYAIPFSRFGLTLAAEATDLFEEVPFPGRGVRLWARLRV